MATQPPHRRRRATCWWEPTFAPELVGQMVPGSWDFSHDIGPTRRFFDGQALVDYVLQTGVRVFRNVTFRDCDFQGFFVDDAQIVFQGCSFLGCDLGLTTWRNVKFANCNFERTSFGQTTFDNCEFRKCNWKQIGISPNALRLERTYLSNPGEFISAAYTNLDPNVLAEKGEDPRSQRSKLEHTKATIARLLLKNLELEGDEEAYYDAVKTFQIQQAQGRLAEAWFTFANPSAAVSQRLRAIWGMALWDAEGILLRVIGWINDWGASIVRPIFLSAVAFLVFAVLYAFLGMPSVQANAMQRSFDIALLAGYGSYFAEENSAIAFTQYAQLLVASILYAITFATILSRFSRVR